MKRRDFFKLGFQKAAGAVVEEAEARLQHRARQWIRPPFAISELDFLIKCSRCGDCTEACPHDVIFPLPAKFGLDVVSTPALDLMTKGCRLCADWPCVAACESGALLRPTMPEEDNTEGAMEDGAPACPEQPKLADVKIQTSLCLPYSGPECGACAHSCPVEGALLWDGPRPHIDPDTCTGCAMCREACITDPKAVSIRAIGATAVSAA